MDTTSASSTSKPKPARSVLGLTLAGAVAVLLGYRLYVSLAKPTAAVAKR